eukprot:gene4808-2354_t
MVPNSPARIHNRVLVFSLQASTPQPNEDVDMDELMKMQQHVFVCCTKSDRIAKPDQGVNEYGRSPPERKVIGWVRHACEYYDPSAPRNRKAAHLSRSETGKSATQAQKRVSCIGVYKPIGSEGLFREVVEQHQIELTRYKEIMSADLEELQAKHDAKMQQLAKQREVQPRDYRQKPKQEKKLYKEKELQPEPTPDAKTEDGEVKSGPKRKRRPRKKNTKEEPATPQAERRGFCQTPDIGTPPLRVNAASFVPGGADTLRAGAASFVPG